MALQPEDGLQSKRTSNTFLEKLVVGTASWANDYGLMNTNHVSLSEAAKILETAKNAGVVGIDTAPAYGGSEPLLGSFDMKQFQIFTKPSLGDGSFVALELLKSIKTSLGHLGVQGVQGITFHSATAFLANHSEFVAVAKRSIDSGACGSWGVSVYEPSELEAVLQSSTPDYIQAPVSIIDQRFVSPKVADMLHAKGVALQARSVYLQGLLLQDPRTLPPRFAAWEPLLTSYVNAAKELGLSMQQLSLRAVLEQSLVRTAAVGVNSQVQMRDLISSIGQDLEIPALTDFTSDSSQALIDPRTWNF